MLTIETVFFWTVVAGVAAVAWQTLGRRLFSAEAVGRRRRDRSHRRVISRRRGPAVRLAVRVPAA